VEVDLCFLHAMCKHCLADDSKQLFAGKVSDDVDLKGTDRIVPLKNLLAILADLASPRGSSRGCHVGD
jgi:hypothetical protein